MTFDAFISYSHQDKTTADAACAALEAKGIRCWIAPRDIVPGMDWGEAIIDAITGAKAMVLIFSGASNVSPQVKREVERAVSRAIPIIPLRLESVPMSKSLEYFLGTSHWLDALTPPLEKHLAHLAESIRVLLKLDTGEIRSAPAPEPRGSEPARPTTPSALNSRGIAYFNRRDYDRAIEDFDDAIRLDPSLANVFYNRGATYQSKGEHDRAIRDFDEAVRLDPKRAAYRANRASAFRAKNEHDRAIENYDEAIRLDPKSAIFWSNRAAAYQSKRDYDRAIQDYDEAIRLNPKFVAALYGRAVAYENKGEYHQAVKAYDEAISAHPRDADALYRRGVTKRHLHDNAGADADFQAATAIDPNVGL